MFRCDEVKNRAAASRSSLRTRMLYANPVTSEFRVIQIGESEHGPAGLFSLFCSWERHSSHSAGYQEEGSGQIPVLGITVETTCYHQHPKGDQYRPVLSV